MKHHAGRDVSLKETSICIADEGGQVVVRGTVATDPDAILGFFVQSPAKGLSVERNGA